MRSTPLAIFTYKRPEHTRLLLESVERCARLDECTIHVYCDGPRRSHEAGDVGRSRAIVRAWTEHRSAKVVERDKNLGLARSIVMGVTELCEKYGRVIVVEDDFVLSPDFLDYMLLALDRYENDERIYQISGFMLPIENPEKPDAFFLPLTTTWGWATWARAWKHFDWNAEGALEKLKDPALQKKFDLDGAYSYSSMLKNRLSGKNDSWGILWWWMVFNSGGMVLHPRKSLVWVGGFDNTGTHCSGATSISQVSCDEFNYRRLSNPIIMPSDIIKNGKALENIKFHLKNAACCGTKGASRRSVIKFARKILGALNVKNGQ